MKIISIVSGKGGVGKTASSVNLATGLAMNGFKTLLMDIDKQSNATTYLGAYNPQKLSVAEILINKVSPSEVIQETGIENLHIIPANYERLEGVQDKILVDINRSRVLRLKSIEKLNYDFIIIDCPPDLSILTMNALAISDYVLVPIKVDIFGLEGFAHITKKVEIIREDYNSKLRLLGAFFTMYNKRTLVNRQVKESLERQLKDKFFKTTIRNSTAFVQSTFKKIPLVKFQPKNNVSIDYMELVKEVIENV